jgi:hypothetical protein
MLEGRCLPSASVTVGANVNISREVSNQNEPTIAVNPTNPNDIVAFSNDENTPAKGIFRAFSTDGGHSWTTGHLGDGSDGLPLACCDGQAVFDQYGNLFLTYLANNGYVEIVLSTDGGKTFSLAHTIADRGADQPSIAVGAGTVWVSYTNKSGEIAAAGTAVTGLGAVQAFTNPEVAPNSKNGDYGDIAIGPSGQVMVTYQLGLKTTQGPDHIYVNVDPDGLGAQGFGPQITVTGTNVGGSAHVPAQSNNLGIDAEANLAWDLSSGPHQGRVYLVYTNRANTTTSNTDIFVRFSDNNGQTWSNAVKVNDDTTTHSQFLPSIAVDQTTGNVAVAWYDARNTPNNEAELFVTFSVDGGVSFLTNVQVSAGASNSRASEPPPRGLRPLGYGDFVQDKGAFTAGVFHPIWADNSNSTGDNPDGTLDELDLYTAAVSLQTASSAHLASSLRAAQALAPGWVASGLDVSASTVANPQDVDQFFTTGQQRQEGVFVGGQ